MQTYKPSYNFQKYFPLTIGIFNIGFVILGLLMPDMITTTVNGKQVETTFSTLLPGVVLGIAMIILAIWLTKNYFSIYMDEEGIKVNRGNGPEQVKWENMESIEGVDWLWKGTIFSVKPKGQMKFYFHSDKPKMGFTTITKGEFRTEMAKFIAEKKQEFSI